MTAASQNSVRNQLLLALEPGDFSLLQPHLQHVELKVRDSLGEPDKPMPFVHFIEEGIGSIVVGPERTTGVEIGIVGREGLVGAPVVLESEQSPHTSFMQVGGSAWRVPGAALAKVMAQSASLRGLLLRYVHAFTMQISSTAYSNADFTVEERLARWILMCHDRVDGDQIAMTHEFIALMLGVRRPGVTVATHVLEGEHMIKARRGMITVLDRDKLKKTADSAYGMAEAEYERVIGLAVRRDGDRNVVRFPTGT